MINNENNENNENNGNLLFVIILRIEEKKQLK